MNVGLAVLAAASAWMVAGVVIASALGPRLRDSADSAGDLPLGARMDRGAGGPLRWLLPASVVCMAFASSTGLAAAGALPERAQVVASTVFRKVGVRVPPAPSREVTVTASPATTLPATGPAAQPPAAATARTEGDGGGVAAPRPSGSGQEDILSEMRVQQGAVEPPPTPVVPPPTPAPAPAPAAAPEQGERAAPHEHSHPKPAEKPAEKPVATTAPADAAPRAPVTTVPAVKDGDRPARTDGDTPTSDGADGSDPTPTTTPRTPATGVPRPSAPPRGSTPPAPTPPVVPTPEAPTTPDAQPDVRTPTVPVGGRDGAEGDDGDGAGDEGATTDDEPLPRATEEPEPAVRAGTVDDVRTDVPPVTDTVGIDAVLTDPVGSALVTAGGSVAASS